MNPLGERPAATERGRWIAQLVLTIGHAQKQARTLSVSRGNCAEAEDLYGRLEAIRIEVEELRRGGWGVSPKRIDPRWTNLFPWTGGPRF